MKQSPSHFTSFVPHTSSHHAGKWIVISLWLAGLSMGLVACGAPTSQPVPAISSVTAVPIATTIATTSASTAPSPTVAATISASSVTASPTQAVVATQPPATVEPTRAPTLVTTAVPPPVVAGPTPPCVQPTLTLGSSKFRIELIARAADGSVAVPADTSDVVYWVQGTQANYVFGLSPSANNLALKTKLKAGDSTKIVWGDCSTEDYVIKTVENGKPDVAQLFDPSAARVSIFVQAGTAADSFLIKAGRPAPQVQATPVPTEENAIDAELSFLETKTSADGKTLTMSIAVKNSGSKSFSLATKDISLTVENAAPLAPLSVEPALPQEIKPGASVTLRITFPKPAGNTAVFKLLDFSSDIYF